MGGIDVLIINAGVMMFENAHETTEPSVRNRIIRHGPGALMTTLSRVARVFNQAFALPAGEITSNTFPMTCQRGNRWAT
ncbi:hypothetical protein SBA3_1530002 [Candidatus Sulfopaludibacter sp. SbA3]|nr:hypothetical protein SBA3_1530002 [Candidatus Sulfopaludibacter sp. SbA3]